MRRILIAALLLAGCAPPAMVPFAGPPPGRVERPYTGLPYYLHPPPLVEGPPPQPVYDERLPVVGHRPLPSGERMARLRALLAAVDAHTYTVGDQPGVADVAALELTIDELAELLAPYPDIEYEVDELRALVCQIPGTAAPRLWRLRARMAELTDLIRVQLVAGA